MKKYVILISGRGSNMQSLLASELPGECVAVISNRPDAAGLEFARNRGVPAVALDHKQFPDRASFDAALAAEIDSRGADLVLLAGFMRVLGADFVRRYEGRMLNIHPSLLPAFPGLHTHAQAIAAGVRVHGCTVHFVSAELDAGPIVIQAVVSVREDDDASSLAARVLTEEHLVYPRAARWFLEGRLSLRQGRVRVAGSTVANNALIAPVIAIP
ncbi:MAG TPA: phosphoribosylglycinamide formyltransferase [Rhodocyclaceae bacterium]